MFWEFISVILGPHVWAPVLIFFTVLKSGLNPGRMALSFLILLVFQFLVPLGFVYYLRWTGQTKRWDVPELGVRFKAILVGLASISLSLVWVYFFGNFFLFKMTWLLIILGVVSAGITKFWKISLHSGINAAGSVVLNFLFGGSLPWLYLSIPLVFLARRKLKRHSWTQLIAGTLLGGGLTLAFLWAFFPGKVLAAEKSYYFPKVTIEVKINPDRSADFLEKRTAAFTGSFTRIYWDIPLKNGQAMENILAGEEVAGQRVIYGQLPTADPGRPPKKYAVSRNSDGSYHIELYQASTNQIRTFLLSYRVTNAVTKYQDVGEFYWKVIGPGWEARTDQALITVTVPEDVGPQGIYIWGHGPLNGKAAIVDGKTATFSVNDLPGKTFVEVRELFPAYIISGRPISEDHLALARAAEEKFQEETVIREQVKVILTVSAVLIFIGWILFWFSVWKKYGREYKIENIPEYVHFPPSKLAPALVEALISQEQSVTSNSFSATILDLARKKLLKLRPGKPGQRGFWGWAAKGNTPISFTCRRKRF